MQILLDTSVLIAEDGPDDLECAISAASLAELHFGVLIAQDADERARRAQRLGIVEATFHPLPLDAAVAREWGRLAAAVASRGAQPRRRAVDLVIAATAAPEAMGPPESPWQALAVPDPSAQSRMRLGP